MQKVTKESQQGRIKEESIGNIWPGGPPSKGPQIVET